MSWVANKCGGARFQTLPDFRVEVEGKGIPTLSPEDPRYSILEQTWKNWAPVIRKWSRIRTRECKKQRKDPTQPGCALLPPSNILAIMTQETGFLSGDKAQQASAGSPAGAVGLMQIMPASVFWSGSDIYKLLNERDRANPDHSVEIGSLLLQRALSSQQGLPAAASSYNAGSVTCYKGIHEQNIFNWHHEQNYAYKVTEYNNTAIAMGVNQDSFWSMAAFGALLGGAGIWWMGRR